MPVEPDQGHGQAQGRRDDGDAREQSQVGISSLIDTWLLVRDIELGGERNRGLYVLKSRGMAHSNQIREFLLTARGVELKDVYVGPEGVLTGSMRLAQEAREQAAAHDRALARGDRIGPLHGVPFTAKDIIETAALPTTLGMVELADNRPAHDATVVAPRRGT